MEYLGEGGWSTWERGLEYLTDFLGPVSDALGTTFLFTVGNHDDDWNLILPEHFPEGYQCNVLRALRRDV